MKAKKAAMAPLAEATSANYPSGEQTESYLVRAQPGPGTEIIVKPNLANDDLSEAASTNVVKIERREPRSAARVFAELGLSPILANTNTTRAFARGFISGNVNGEAQELDITEAMAVMREKASSVQAGNLAGLDEILTAQAATLDAIFNRMASQASAIMGKHLHAAEIYLRLGLKAQAQCRATIQTMSEMKNPHPVAFVRQANIAHGPQQVNNGIPASGSSSRAGKPANKSNELLELNHEQRLDTGTEGAAGGTYSELATVGAFQRSED